MLMRGVTQIKLMADEGIWLSTQPFTVCNEPQLNDVSNAKLAVVCKGTEFVYKSIKKFPKLKVTYGTDIFNDPVNINNIFQGCRLQYFILISFRHGLNLVFRER
jgi:hypothetical protein